MLSRHFAFALAATAPFILVACNKSTSTSSYDTGTQPGYVARTQPISTPTTRGASPRSTRKHEFTYFPSAQVYFDTETGAWFWPQGSGWKTGPSLPGAVRVSTADGVPVQLDTDIPYEHHDVVTRFYPAQPKGTRTAIGQ